MRRYVKCPKCVVESTFRQMVGHIAVQHAKNGDIMTKTDQIREHVRKNPGKTATQIWHELFLDPTRHRFGHVPPLDPILHTTSSDTVSSILLRLVDKGELVKISEQGQKGGKNRAWRYYDRSSVQIWHKGKTYDSLMS